MSTALPHELTTDQRAALEALAPLTEQERLAATEQARRNVIRALGARPELAYPPTPQPARADYDQATISEYPAWVQRTIGGMLLIAFVGAFLMSSFAVFSAGRNHWLAAFQGITAPDVGGWQAPIVGGATVALSEFLVITATLAARVYLVGRRRWQLVMGLPVLSGLVLAVTLNAVISQPNTWSEWLLTAIPPGATVFLALIAEQVILVDVRRRRANENAYTKALADWQASRKQAEAQHREAVRAWEHATRHPEEHPRWAAYRANAYREAITASNSRGQGSTARREVLARLTVFEWRALVARELAALEWWQEPTPRPLAIGPQGQPDRPALPEPTPIPATPNGNGTNHNGTH